MYRWADKDGLARFLPCYYALDKRPGQSLKFCFSTFPYEGRCYLSMSKNGKAELVSSENSDVLQGSHMLHLS